MSTAATVPVLTTYRKIERKITPGLRYSQAVYEEVLTKLVTPETRWVDVGCGHSVLAEWRPNRERLLVSRPASIIGVDIDREAALRHRSIKDIRIGSIYDLPIESNSADLVTANMVVEHLDQPARAFTEVKRVLRTGGTSLSTHPTYWDTSLELRDCYRLRSEVG